MVAAMSAGCDDGHRVGPAPASHAPLGRQRYAWATDIFDYFSVLCPQDDYMANVDPAGADPTVIGSRGPVRCASAPIRDESGVYVIRVDRRVNANRANFDAEPTHGIADGDSAPDGTSWPVEGCQ